MFLLHSLRRIFCPVQRSNNSVDPVVVSSNQDSRDSIASLRSKRFDQLVSSQSTNIGVRMDTPVSSPKLDQTVSVMSANSATNGINTISLTSPKRVSPLNSAKSGSLQSPIPVVLPSQLLLVEHDVITAVLLVAVSQEDQEVPKPLRLQNSFSGGSGSNLTSPMMESSSNYSCSSLGNGGRNLRVKLDEFGRECPKDENGIPRLTIAQVEGAIIERCNLPFPSHTGPFTYLLGCFQRASDALALVDKKNNEISNLKISVLNQCLEILVAYAGMCLSGMLAERDLENTKFSFIRLLEADSSLNKTLPKGFLTALVAKCTADNMLEEQFGFVFNYISTTLLPAPISTISVETGQPVSIVTLSLESALKCLRLVEALATQQPLAEMIVNLPKFSANNCSNGRDVELKTILGPSFGIGSFSPEFSAQIHKSLQANVDPHIRPKDYFTLNETIKLLLASLQNQLFRTLNSLMRANAACREVCLQWVSAALHLNAPRSKYYFNEAVCCSHNFAINLSAVLVRLCRPVIDSKLEKMKLVDLRYLLGGSKSRLDYSKIDRMSATNTDIRILVETEMKLDDALVESNLSSITPRSNFALFQPNFVTEIFFLSLQSLHLGLMRAVKAKSEFGRVVGNFFRAFDEVCRKKPDRDFGPGSLYDQEYQVVLTRLRIALSVDQMHEISLANLETLRSVALFYEWTCGFYLNRLAIADLREQSFLKLMPEHFVENVVEFFDLLGHIAIDIIKTEKWQSLLSFVCQCMQRGTGDSQVQRTAVGELLIVGQSALIKNPHLRAMLADILCLFLPPRQPDQTFRREIDHPFVSHPTLAGELVPSLLKLYVDVEYTGRHAQFYEKFNSRQKINQLLEFVWDNAKHRATFDTLSHSDKEDFPRFINTVISDSIFLLDESIKFLTAVREIEEKKDNLHDWNQLSQEQRQELEQAYEGNGGQAKTMMTFGKTTFRLLVTLARFLTHAFVHPMFAQSMAHMLDYYIFTLAGPKVRELKVKNMEKYNFSPKLILRDVLLIFIPLCSSDVFKHCVINDRRSYHPSIFRSALNLARNKGILVNIADVNALDTQIQELESMHTAMFKKSDNDVTNMDVEIPEEFVDPITQDIMDDPVLLPSRTICDRSTITRHLWSQPTDPFTQMPLKAEQLVDVPALKEKIAKWKVENKYE